MKIKKDELYKLDAVEIYKMVLKNELKRFPQYFWEKPDSLNSSKEIVTWLIEEKLKLNDEQIKEKLSHKFFKDNNLGGMVSCLFNDSPYATINNAYPNKFKPWELKITFKNYWNKETGIQAMKWLIEEKLKWDDEQIKNKLSTQIFQNNNLGGMLSCVFQSSPFKAIDAVYPNRFKPWEFNMAPLNYWNKQTGVEAIKWLIEEKLKLNDKQIKEKLSTQIFQNNNLGGMLFIFNNSPYEAINTLYPGKFKPWELNMTPLNYWNKQTGVEATKWLIEEKLKWNDEQIKNKLSTQVFQNNNLGGMIYHVFNNSPYDAINNIYPNRFKPWQFKKTPNSYWNLQTGIEAIKWLITEKLKWTDKDIKKKLTIQVFYDNNLGGMINTLFNGSPYNAINTVYPNKFKPWELIKTQNYWTLETGIEAIKWLIEDKLRLTNSELKEKLSKRLFEDNDLSGMLSSLFNNSPFNAINIAYPGKFKKEEFKNYNYYK